MALTLKDNTGEFVDVDEMLDRDFTPKELEKGLLCSDFDHSMIDRDFGFLLFLEKLSDPRFWTMSPSRFRRILLPHAYDELIMKALGESEDSPDGSNYYGIDSNDCRFLLNLRDDICELYGAAKDISGSGNSDFDIEDPLLNEFARKMAAFDKLLIKIDAVLMKQMDGRLLSRTRFFARKRKADVRTLTERAISRTVDDNLELAVHDENRGVIQ